VVVEGVARSLDPHINIWEVAKPIVEGYIKQNIGPRALLRDLAKTARVLARFGPKLPALVEAQLIRTGNPLTPTPNQRRDWHPVVWGLLVATAFAAGLLARGYF
jgi:ubiquinone biosynthesis protein